MAEIGQLFLQKTADIEKYSRNLDTTTPQSNKLLAHSTNYVLPTVITLIMTDARPINFGGEN